MTPASHRKLPLSPAPLRGGGCAMISHHPWVRDRAVPISPLPSGGEGEGEGESHRENH